MKKTILIVIVLTLGLAMEVAKADFTFGTPVNLGPTVNSPAIDGHPSISADGLSIFFYSERPGGYGDRDIWLATRATKDEDWSLVENAGSPVNTPYRDSAPTISADGLMLFFDSDRPGGSGNPDIWMTTRETKDSPWTTPVNLGPTVNSPAYDYYPSVSSDGLVLFFDSDRGGSDDNVWMTTRQSRDDVWTLPVILGPPINSSAGDGEARISHDGLALFFASTRTGGYGSSWNIWVATRTKTDGDWSTPVNLGPTINGLGGAAGAIASVDGSTLYFASLRSSNVDLWQAPIIRIVDFNGDGIIDSADMCIIVDNWNTDNSLCDIGPMPWGDGVVDVEDLKVLADHLFEEDDDPTLIAHWPLNEAQGDIAYNSATDCNGTLMGSPVWQPDGGVLAGALQFDGNDDYVSTPFVLNPAGDKFSVLIWAKGGVPDQVVLSQTGVANWLLADPSDGNLMTELKAPVRSGKPLQSQTNITDGNWHRIGLVWDGSNRILYVDGAVVAEDTQEGMEGSDNGLYIGCGKNMEAGTFWSGLIDDIRIYSRVVHP